MTNSHESRPADSHEATETFGGVDISVSVQVPRSTDLARGYVHGIDGKRYRSRPLTAADRSGLVLHVHGLAHEQKLSVRQIVGSLDVQHGVRVSVGAVHGYLTKWTCVDCSAEPSGAPEQLGGVA